MRLSKHNPEVCKIQEWVRSGVAVKQELSRAEMFRLIEDPLCPNMKGLSTYSPYVRDLLECNVRGLVKNAEWKKVFAMGVPETRLALVDFMWTVTPSSSG